MLLTGAAGFIGSNFVRYELAHDPDVQIISFDKLTYAGNLKNLSGLNNSRHRFLQGDICDHALMLKIFNDYHIDTIVHFAAESHVDRSITNPFDFVQTNVMGTLSLLQAAKTTWENKQSQRRFHHISTDEVYGMLTKNDPPFTEKNPYQPNSPYAASKAGSDHLVRAFAHTYQLPITLSNCSNNYGPYQHSEKLIPTIIHACLQQQSIPIYGDGSNIRDWIFVTDHCAAVHHIIRKGYLGETYNVGGECEMNNLTLAKTITTLMDAIYPQNQPHEKLITFVTDRPGHDWRYAIDNHKIKTQLGWRPNTSIIEGLKKTIEFYKPLNAHYFDEKLQ